jgi:hypothetical protein
LNHHAWSKGVYKRVSRMNSGEVSLDSETEGSPDL